jgi:uncharacterized protein YecE (DUF72 family)
MIHLGTQGWAYPDWIGVFYPPGSKQQHYLPFYSEVFDTVELDTTFYGLPSASVVRSWDRHTPDHFRFAAKVPREITHDASLVNAHGAMREFVLGLAPLGDKLGPLLIQLPAEFARSPRSEKDLLAFLDGVPPGVRLAVEFRHRSWHAEEVIAELAKRNVAAAWTQWRDLPALTRVTADFLYVRWIGDNREIEKFDRVLVDRTDAFERWEGDMRRALPEVREVYGYFNNHWAGHSPASAAEMKRRLGLTPVDPRGKWTQKELW